MRGPQTGSSYTSEVQTRLRSTTLPKGCTERDSHLDLRLWKIKNACGPHSFRCLLCSNLLRATPTRNPRNSLAQPNDDPSNRCRRYDQASKEDV